MPVFGYFLKLLQFSRFNKISLSRFPIVSQTSTKLPQPLRINFSRLGSVVKLGVFTSL
ncbi:hypothetical protein LguiA_026884 [Lonicera macranthoides]